ncbi:MAG: GNAT family N-acetyltransferase [Patescibacteria group bacterium]
MSIIITEPTWEQKDALRAFYERVYRLDHPLTNDAFLEWFLRDTPYHDGQGLSCKIACDGDAIVGNYNYIPVRIWAGEEVIRGRWAANLVVDPAYRKQGIASRLIEALASETDVAVDIGASAIAEGILQKRGWTHLGILRRYVGVLDPTGASLLAEDHSLAGRCVLREERSRETPTPAVETVERFSDDVDAFWRTYRRGIRYAVERDQQFLRWRYCAHPFFRYTLFQIKDGGGRLAGISVVRMEEVKGLERPQTVCRIVEFLAFPEYREPLLRHAVRYAREQRAVLIDFFCASRAYATAFEQFGFQTASVANQFARCFNPILFAKYTISFNGKRINEDIDPAIFSSQEDWYVTTGDGDQDRPNTNSIG